MPRLRADAFKNYKNNIRFSFAYVSPFAIYYFGYLIVEVKKIRLKNNKLTIIKKAQKIFF